MWDLGRGTGVVSALAPGLAVREEESLREKMVASDVLWLLPSGLYPSESWVFCLLILASKTDANLCGGCWSEGNILSLEGPPPIV